MENPIEERNRAETRQTVEMITESKEKNQYLKQEQDKLRSNAGKLQDEQNEKDSEGHHDSR